MTTSGILRDRASATDDQGGDGNALAWLHQVVITLKREPGISTPEESSAADDTEELIALSLSGWAATFAEVPPTPIPVRLSALQADVNPDILDFCRRKGVLRHLRYAIRLIEECFPGARQLRLEVEQDPETDDEWLSLNFTVAGDITDVLDRYDEYTDRWVRAVPWPESDKICLCYHIV